MEADDEAIAVHGRADHRDPAGAGDGCPGGGSVQEAWAQLAGVLQVEALAQTGGILCINAMPEGQYDTYFIKIENCKFKQKVVPGDTMILKMELIEPIRRGICVMRGSVYVGNKLCTEGDLTAQLVKRP